MKKIILLLGVVSFFLNVNAQSYDWGALFGGLQSDEGRNVKIDNNGNIYCVGTFKGTVDFDPGPGAFSLTSNGLADIFVMKLYANGNLAWVKKLGNNYDEYSSLLAIDVNSNVFIIGTYSGTIDVDPGVGVYNLTGSSSCSFLLKLDSVGDFVWAMNQDFSNGLGAAQISIDSKKSLVMCGYFYGTVDFDPGPNVFNLSVNGDSDMFILKLDNNGGFIDAWNIGGTGFERPVSMCLDHEDNMYITGHFNFPADMDPGTGVVTLNHNNAKDVFIAKYDSVCNIAWAKSIGGIDDDAGSVVQVDAVGNVYLLGSFYDTLDCDPGVSVYEIVSTGSLNYFVSKLNPNGNFVWAYGLGDPNCDPANSMKVDPVGNVYISGGFNNVFDFGFGNPYNLVSSGGNDVYVVKFDTNGAVVWTRNFGGGSTWPSDGSRALALDNDGNIVITGYVGIEADLDPGPGGSIYTTAGDIDAFVVKLNPCPENTSTMVETACSSFNFFGMELTASGNYTHPIMLPNGCDSIVRLDLTIVSVDTSVIQNGNELVSNAIGATYQWIDCGNANMPVVGAIGQSFSPLVNGDYAVVVTTNGCTDTSACYSVNNVRFDELEAETKINVSLNHRATMLMVTSSKTLSNIEIYNNTGQLLVKITCSSFCKNIDVSALAPGNYFVRVVSKRKVWVEKIVVVR